MKMKIKKLSMIALTGIIGSSMILSCFTSPTFALGKNIEHEYDLEDLERQPPIVPLDIFKNADFEQGQTADWHIKGEKAEVVEVGNIQGKAGKMGPTTEANADSHIWQKVTLKPNTNYTIKAKIKFICASSDDRSLFAVSKFVSEGNGSYFKNKQIAPSAEWQNVDLSFTTDDQTEYYIGLTRWKQNASETLKNSTVYIDDLEIMGPDDTQGGIDEASAYEFIWADDFKGEELDSTNWGYELGSIRGVEQQHYTKEKDNVYVDNGKLTLQITDRAKEDQYQNPRGSRQVIYDSGSIRTHGKQEFLYGRIEMKAKLPAGKGVFPAFWMLGSDFSLDGRINEKQGQPWPVCGEVDIMELVGKENDNTPGGNQTVHQTLHYGPAKDIDNGKYARNGTSYSLKDGTFNDDYHVFGLNWSKGKMEWYVDNQVIKTIDYSDDPLATLTLDRPQYVQLNLAAGGNWPGDASQYLHGKKMEVEYVYYAQNEQQKADAKEYYDNAAEINGVKDITMFEGESPNLLDGITSTKNTTVDFSVENEHMFTNVGGNTNVVLVCSGKDDATKLAKLPVGQYNIHYTTKSNNKEDGLKPETRRTALLTVKPLQKQVVKDELEKALKNITKLDKNIYTAESWNQLQIVINKAQSIYENENVSQDAVDNIIQELNEAIKKLVKNPSTDVTDPSDNNGNSEKPSDSVHTGDNASILLLTTLSIMSGTGYLLLKNRKEMDN